MQQGGSPYGAPPHDSMTPFSSPPSAAAAVPLQQQQQQVAEGGGTAEYVAPQSISVGFPPPSSSAAAPNYEELGAAEVDPLGDKGDTGGMWSGGGNRWPRQETLALLKIRSDMDATFRDATLKGPLWEEVSRKLAEMGYRRSGKKCKEKFENVHKYYKRTKEGRAGRQDAKSYRFFTQLEALHATSAATPEPPHFTPAAAAAAMGTPAAAAVTNQSVAAARFSQTPPPQQQQQQISAPTLIATAPPLQQQQPMLGHEHQRSFSSNTSSDALESDDGDDGEEDEDEATEEGPSSGKKRKRAEGGAGGRKMMALFEGLMRQVMERQEAMQQRLLEAIEERDRDRTVREEAWRRQEAGRLARLQELAAAERNAAAARDAVVISFLQKVTGETVPIPSHAATAPAPPPLQSAETVRHQYHQPQQPTPQPPARPTPTELVPLSLDRYEGGATMSVDAASSSRWPKSEVDALIKLRCELESRYQESGPKGPLWEEISAGMQRLGYGRSPKRCKEKWENINKYFKKVKESNKKRPEDAKTCPYFHQLDALYRNKLLSGGGGSGVPALTNRPNERDSRLNPSPIANPISVVPPTMNRAEMDLKKGSGGDGSSGFGDDSAGGSGNNSTSGVQ